MDLRREIFEHYVDRDGLVTIDRDPTPQSTGNGLLFTSIYLVLQKLRGEITDEDGNKFIKPILNCQIEPGLYNRNPGRPDREAWDDYVGIAAVGAMLYRFFSTEIVQYGSRNAWCFNNENPGHFKPWAWHGRFLGLIGVYLMAAGQQPSFLQKLLIGSMLRSGVARDNADPGAKITTWLKTVIVKNYSAHWDDDILEFNRSIVKHFGSLSGLFACYFGPTHPFSVTAHPLST